MNLYYLKYLLKVVSCGSLSQAAKELYVSQPTLTKAIAALEKKYRIRIFIREARGIRLTEDGAEFVHYAKDVLAAVNAMNCHFSDPGRTGRSRLFLATQQFDFVHKLIVKTIQTQDSGKVHYNIVEADRENVVKMVLDNRVDMGLLVVNNIDEHTVLWDASTQKLDLYVLDASESYFCVGPKSPYYDREVITRKEARVPLQILLDMDAQANELLYTENPHSTINPENVIFVNNCAAAERFLLETDALMYPSKWTVGCLRDPRIHILKLAPDKSAPTPKENRLVLIRRAALPLTAAELQFLTYLFDYFHKALPDDLFGSVRNP